MYIQRVGGCVLQGCCVKEHAQPVNAAAAFLCWVPVWPADAGHGCHCCGRHDASGGTNHAPCTPLLFTPVGLRVRLCDQVQPHFVNTWLCSMEGVSWHLFLKCGVVHEGVAVGIRAPLQPIASFSIVSNLEITDLAMTCRMHTHLLALVRIHTYAHAWSGSA